MSPLRPALVSVALLFAPAAAAQQPAVPPRDTVRLGALLQDAERTDPRRRELDLQGRQTGLRLRNLAAERLPVFSGEGLAQVQSDVVRVPLQLPSGQRIPSPSRDTYDARVAVQQSIYDPSLTPRRALEVARSAETEARTRTTLFPLRQEVTEAFFTAAAVDARRAAVVTTLDDLEARRREAATRVREGAALPSDTAAILATMIQRRQDLLDLGATRRAALSRLSLLTGRDIPDSVALALPDLAANVAAARSSLGTLKARPEFEQFARTRDRVAAQERAAGARERPRLSAFGRAGYGRPGLNLLSDRFDTYWITGLQVQWSPWNWGTVDREQETLQLERQIVDADESAFRQAIERGVQNDLAAVARLDSTLALDEQLIALRERIEAETQLRFREGVTTAAEYLDRNTDVLEARLARATHRVEQAQAQARLLTTLGLNIR